MNFYEKLKICISGSNSLNNFLFERINHKLKYSLILRETTSISVPFECKTVPHPRTKLPGQFPLILRRTNPPEIIILSERKPCRRAVIDPTSIASQHSFP